MHTGRLKIKVCGMTQTAQVMELARMGIDWAGFIFYPSSKRYVFNHLTPIEIRNIGGIAKAGVFVNATVEEVLQTVDECRLQAVQLHGDETPDYCRQLMPYATVIKVFRIGEGMDVTALTAAYADACQYYLFDTMGAAYGGTGKKFDWELLKKAAIGKPFFLSGGIRPGDETVIGEFAKSPAANYLYALDINSGFEVSAGVKDLDQIKIFAASCSTL